MAAPVVGFGTGNSSATPAAVGEAVARALAAGLRHLDCAPLYANQAAVGAALASFVAKGAEHEVWRHDAAAGGEPRGVGGAGAAKRKQGRRVRGVDKGAREARESLWVTSKLWLTNFAPEHVEPACRHTLGELKLEYLDLYLLHAPVALQHTGIPAAERTPRDAHGNARTADVPIAATWAAMEKLVSAGLCRHIGVSNFSLGELDAVLDCVTTVRPAYNQIEVHPHNQQRQLVDGCIARGVTPVAFSPLGHGGDVLRDPHLQAIAAAHGGVSVAQVCLQWNLQRGVTVIPHTLDPSELAENAAVARGAGAASSADADDAVGGAAAVRCALTDEEMATIARLDRGDRCLVLDWGEADPGPLLRKKREPALAPPEPVPPGVLRLWHIPTSRSSRCMWLHAELQQAYGRQKRLPEIECRLDAKGWFRRAKPDWFLELNPNGKVPVVEERGQPPLWDSGAICLAWLDRFDREGLLAPRDDPSFSSVFHRVAFFCSNTLDNLGAMSSPIQRAVVDYDREGATFVPPGEVPEAVAANRRAWRAVGGPTLARILAEGGGYMWEGRFTAADVFAGVALMFLHFRRWLDDFPAVARYYRTLRERPAFKVAVRGHPAHRDPFDDTHRAVP